MPDYVIKVENLSKSYIVHHRRERYTALRDVLAEAPRQASRKLLRRGNSRPPTRDEFWALQDVSFELQPGERLGIIGRNGAGKTTLLKILSRITEPTLGEVRLRGRVASLLEVGTGFHPELTGRENVYLNGAILGMTRREIQRRFDEIVAFAEVERFLDTPVKRYSSGMYVRLAFAVAAHLEPDILLVDEVLAVGDVAFQKKCLGKMGDVAREGRTVLFVSHDMGAVARLCRRAVWLQEGRLVDDDLPPSVIARYLATVNYAGVGEVNLANRTGPFAGGKAKLLRARLGDTDGKPVGSFFVDDSIVIEFDVEYYEDSTGFTHSVQIHNSDGTPIYNIWDIDFVEEKPPPALRRTITVQIDHASLYPDEYYVSLWIGDNRAHTVDQATNCIRFSVSQNDPQIRWRLTKRVGLVWKSAQWKYSSEKLSSPTMSRGQE